MVRTTRRFLVFFLQSSARFHWYKNLSAWGGTARASGNTYFQSRNQRHTKAPKYRRRDALWQCIMNFSRLARVLECQMYSIVRDWAGCDAPPGSCDTWTLQREPFVFHFWRGVREVSSQGSVPVRSWNLFIQETEYFTWCKVTLEFFRSATGVTRLIVPHV